MVNKNIYIFFCWKTLVLPVCLPTGFLTLQHLFTTHRSYFFFCGFPVQLRGAPFCFHHRLTSLVPAASLSVREADWLSNPRGNALCRGLARWMSKIAELNSEQSSSNTKKQMFTFMQHFLNYFFGGGWGGGAVAINFSLSSLSFNSYVFFQDRNASTASVCIVFFLFFLGEGGLVSRSCLISSQTVTIQKMK